MKSLNGVDISAVGNRAIAWGPDENEFWRAKVKVDIHDVPSGSYSAEFTTVGLKAATIAPDGRAVLTFHSGHVLKLWDCEERRTKRKTRLWLLRAARAMLTTAAVLLLFVVYFAAASVTSEGAQLYPYPVAAVAILIVMACSQWWREPSYRFDPQAGLGPREEAIAGTCFSFGVALGYFALVEVFLVFYSEHPILVVLAAVALVILDVKYCLDRDGVNVFKPILYMWKTLFVAFARLSDWIAEVRVGSDPDSAVTGEFSGSMWRVVLHDLNTGRRIRSQFGLAKWAILSSNGLFLLSFESFPFFRSRLRLRSLQTGHVISTVPPFEFGERPEVFASDGRKATFVHNNHLIIWDVAGNSIQRHELGITSAAMDRDAALAIGEGGGKARVLDLKGGVVATIRLSMKESRLVRVSDKPGSTLFAYIKQNGQSRDTSAVFDAKSVTLGHSEPVEIIALDPSGRTAISASQDATVRLWDVENGCQLRTISGHFNALRCICWSKDGSQAMTQSRQEMCVWDLAATGDEFHGFAALIRPKSRLLTAWKTAECFAPLVRGTITLEGLHAINPDFFRVTNVIISVTESGTLEIHTLDGKLVRTLEGHESRSIACR